MEKNETKEVTTNTTIIVEGTIVEARIGRTKYSDDVKNRICIKSDSIPYDDIHAFDGSGARMTPKWFLDQTGFINLSSQYDVPVMDSRGIRIDFETWISKYNALGSTVRAAITQTDGAVYPKAIKVIEDGEERDPFEDL